MSSSNWGGKRIGAGKKSSWSDWEKIAIGAKCEEIQRKSREKQALDRYWAERGFTKTDRKERQEKIKKLFDGNRAAISDLLKWIEKDLAEGRTYEDSDEWLQDELRRGELTFENHQAMQDIIDNRDAGFTNVMIHAPLGRGFKRKRICQMTARIFRDNPKFTTPSPHSVDRMWKWYRKFVLADDNLI